MEQWFAIASQNDTENDGQQSKVDFRRFLLTGNDESKNGSKERGGGADSLVEGDGKVTKRSVSADDGEAEDCTESSDLEELTTRDDVLEGDELQPVDGDEAVGGAG
uniref:Uncharacterized protein n=1 Tax=Nelumbo nucifera TaxID=4432 RepID=A0A822YMR4_NELNU|nr:TPA_asm: hypothetical protein HUJ06_012628 [Nelumbo nucifera]